jgi:hypothetical protein
MSRICDICNQDYSSGIGYELRDDKGKLQEKVFGHHDCIQPKIEKIKSKLNKRKVK